MNKGLKCLVETDDEGDGAVQLRHGVELLLRTPHPSPFRVLDLEHRPDPARALHEEVSRLVDLVDKEAEGDERVDDVALVVIALLGKARKSSRHSISSQ